MDWSSFISQYDLIYETPPVSWQDGFVLGNGSLGAVFSAPQALEWIVNKTDVIDGRVHGVRKVVPKEAAALRVAGGATPADFEGEERGEIAPEGAGPKSCCRLLMDLGTTAGAGNRSSLPECHCRLALYEATLHVHLDKHLCHPRVESFICSDQNTLLIRVREVSPLVSYRTNLDFSRPEDAALGHCTVVEEGGRLLLQMQMPQGPNYIAAMQVVPQPTLAYRETFVERLRPQYQPPILGDVQMRVVGSHGIASVGGDFDIYLTVISSNDSNDPKAEAHEHLDRAVETTYESLRSLHRETCADFWKKSWVELGDKALEQLFYQSLYALRTAYRGAPISGLLGLCYGPSPGPIQVTPWNGDLHHDQNVQCPFLPVHALNHSELFDAYLETYQEFLPEARRLAREVWSTEGAHFDMAFNALGRSVYGGVGAYRFFFGGSYIALMHCLCWKYRRDVEQLRHRIYPFLKEVLTFYLGIAQKGTDGFYHFWPAHTPELDITSCGDPVQNVSMLKVCLQTGLEAAPILGDSGPHLDRWRDLLECLPSYPTVDADEGGRRILDAEGIRADHHISQVCGLYPVYPCGEVDISSPSETLAIYQRTLDIAVKQIAQKSYAIEQGFYFHNIWQCFFLAMATLRLGNIEEFWTSYLPMMLRVYSKPNGLMSHDATVIVNAKTSELNLESIPVDSLQDLSERMPVFEPWCGHQGDSTPNPLAKAFSIPLIEGSSDFLSMITETLLQSHNGLIRIFPGWRKGMAAQFFQLVAEGAVLVSAKMGAGGVEFVRLEPRLGTDEESVRIESPWSGEIEIWRVPAGGITLTEKGESSYAPSEPTQPFAEARPRILFENESGPLWLGRKRGGT